MVERLVRNALRIKKTARTTGKALRKAGNSGRAQATRKAGRAAAKQVMADAPTRKSVRTKKLTQRSSNQNR